MDTVSTTLDNIQLNQEYTVYFNEIISHIKLANTVVSFTNKTSINIDNLLLYIKSKNIQYKYTPRKFSGLAIKFIPSQQLKELEPNLKTITFLIFKTGKIVVVGLKFSNVNKLDIIKTDLETLLTESKCTEEVSLNYKLANKVYSFSVPKPILFKSLKQLTKGPSWIHTEYNPAIFPGLTLRIPNVQSIFLIFNKGNIIFTGNKSDDNLNYSIKYLLKCLEAIKNAAA